jgi:hypothetical protein
VFINQIVIVKPLPRAINIAVMDDTLMVDLENGRTISVSIGWTPHLAYGTAVERANFKSAVPVWHSLA